MALKRGYSELQAWQKSMDLVDAIYSATKLFPKEEMYGISSQIRRSAASIPANLAEGASRSSTKEFIRFTDIALGSLAETETHLMIANRQGYLDGQALNILLDQAAEIGRMMRCLRQSLAQKLETDTTNRQPLAAIN